MHLQEIYVWPWPKVKVTSSKSHEALISTSCTCKVWSCYGQWLMRCIYKKIHYLILTPRSRGSRSPEMLPSTFDIAWPMHQQSLMLLHPKVKEKMHLQENTLFDLEPLTLWAKSHEMLPSTLYIMWPIQLQSLKLFRRRFIYKKRDGWTDWLTEGGQADFGLKLIYLFFLKKKADIINLYQR